MLPIEQQEEDILRTFIGLLPTPKGTSADANAQIKYITENFRAVAISYFRKVQEIARRDAPQERQTKILHAIEMLMMEWGQIRNSIDYLQSLNETQSEANRGLESIIGLARSKLQIKSDISVRVLPVIGTRFFMLRPAYVNDAILCIPLYALSNEEDLKAIWHEMANLVVNPDNKVHLSGEKNGQYHPHLLFPLLGIAPEKIVWSDYEGAIAQRPELSVYRQLLQTPANPSYEGWDIFWMYSAKQINPRWQDLSRYAMPSAENNVVLDWRIAHLEELSEDACSTLIFGLESYANLMRIMQRYYADDFENADLRHPAPSTRLEVTYQLLKCMYDTVETPDDDPLKQRHDTIPGARELARWIYQNRANLVREEKIALDTRSLTDKLAAFANFYHRDDPIEGPVVPTDARVGGIMDAIVKARNIDTLDAVTFARLDPGESTGSTASGLKRALGILISIFVKK